MLSSDVLLPRAMGPPSPDRWQEGIFHCAFQRLWREENVLETPGRGGRGVCWGGPPGLSQGNEEDGPVYPSLHTFAPKCKTRAVSIMLTE